MASLIIRPGQVWRAIIPYSDGPGSKTRPALVLGGSPGGRREDQIVLMVPCTTFDGDPAKARGGDIPVPAAAGLDAGTFVRTRRLMAIDPIAIEAGGLVATVDDAFLAIVLNSVAKLFDGNTRAY